MVVNGIDSDNGSQKEMLSNQGDRYRFLYAKLPAMLHSIDRSGRLIDVNDYWLATLGYKRSEVIGRRAVEFLTEESRRYAVTTTIPEFLKTGYARDISYQFINKDGEKVDILLSAITERDEEGNFIRSLAVLVERQRMKNAIQEPIETTPNFSQLSDEAIRKIFCDRFRIKYGEVIRGSSQAAHHMTAILTDMSREKFGVIYLNARNEFISSEILFEGTLTTAAVYPREVIKRALAGNAAGIIIGHNHPSGSVLPSLRDQEITRAIKRACKAVGIVLHDHLVIGYDKWFSFSDQGLL